MSTPRGGAVVKRKVRKKISTANDFPPVPPKQELNSRWEEFLADYGPKVGGSSEEMEKLSDEQRWQMVCLYDLQRERIMKESILREPAPQETGTRGGGGGTQQKEDLRGRKPRRESSIHTAFAGRARPVTPFEWFGELKRYDTPFTLEQAELLKLQMRGSSASWLKEFYDYGGLRAIIERLTEIACEDEKSNSQLLLQSELLKSLKAAMNHKLGVDAMTSDPALMPALALNLDSEDAYIATQALELLAVVMVDGPEGHRTILDSLDYFKLVKGERCRFFSLVRVLWSDDTELAFKRDVLLFLNTLLNSSKELEQRIEMRADMVYAGILDVFEKLKDSPEGLEAGEISDDRYDLEMQMQLFETVMHADNNETLHEVRGIETITLAEPSMLFDALSSLTMEFDCFAQFLSTLQHLLLIPTYDQLGKEMWEQVEDTVHAIVVPDGEKDFELTYGKLKELHGWKERVEEMSQDLAEKNSSMHTLNESIKELEEKLARDDQTQKIRDLNATILLIKQEKEKLEEDLKASASAPASATSTLVDDPEKDKQIEELKKEIEALKAGGAAPVAVMKLKDDPEFAKYFKMLSMHLPKQAVVMKMEAEGKDPKVLDMDPEGPSPNQPASGAPVEVMKLKDDPEFAKYFKMLSMHLPKQAVVMKMEAEGKDPKVLDMDPEGPSPNQPASGAPVEVMKLKDDPEFAKYFKMLSMHLPKQAVVMKMEAEGKDPKVLDMDPEGPSPNQPASGAPVEVMKLKDDPEFAKYFKMLSMHLPKQAVVMKMQAEGKDPKVLDMDPEGPSPNQQGGGDAQPKEAVKLKDDPRFAKYFKMLSMHLPRLAVENKMKAEGRDPKYLDMDPEGPAPPEETSADSDDIVVMKLKDDPMYAKYFKMLRMHLPKGAVLAKMISEGLDGKVLDMDPESPSPNSTEGQLTKMLQPKRTGGGFALPPRPPPKPKYPKKESEKPPVPMRALFWTRVQTEDIDKTVWARLKDDAVNLPVDQLLETFAKQQAKKANTEEGAAADLRKSEGSNKKKEVNLLDPKVLQNVGIALAKYRMPIQDIKLAILRMDEALLNLEKVTSLYNLRPTPEDRSAVLDYEGDRSQLGKVEKFFLEISVIPRYDQRLECFIFKLRFNKEMDELRHSLEVVRLATNEMIVSKRFHRILEVVLKLGNFLNGGTSRGGLYGFRLDALVKLGTIKSVDNKQTLLNFLADYCHHNEPGLMNVAEELEHIPAARRIPLQTWLADFKQVQRKVQLVETQIEQSKKDEEMGRQLEHDRFVDAMQTFHERAKDLTDDLQKLYEHVEDKFKHMLTSFGEDPSVVGCQEFFGDVMSEFLHQFAKAKQQNEKRRLLEEKARQKAEAARLKQEQKEARLKAIKDAEKLVEGSAHHPSSPAKRQGARRRGLSTASEEVDNDSSAPEEEGLAEGIFARMRTVPSPSTQSTAERRARRSKRTSAVSTSSAANLEGQKQLMSMMSKLGNPQTNKGQPTRGASPARSKAGNSELSSLMSNSRPSKRRERKRSPTRVTET